MVSAQIQGGETYKCCGEKIYNLIGLVFIKRDVDGYLCRCTMSACSGVRSVRYSSKARKAMKVTLQTGTLQGRIKKPKKKPEHSFKTLIRVLGLDGRLKSKKEIEGLNKVSCKEEAKISLANFFIFRRCRPRKRQRWCRRSLRR